jgi:hypothetical protein
LVMQGPPSHREHFAGTKLTSNLAGAKFERGKDLYYKNAHSRRARTRVYAHSHHHRPYQLPPPHSHTRMYEFVSYVRCVCVCVCMHRLSTHTTEGVSGSKGGEGMLQVATDHWRRPEADMVYFPSPYTLALRAGRNREVTAAGRRYYYYGTHSFFWLLSFRLMFMVVYCIVYYNMLYGPSTIQRYSRAFTLQYARVTGAFVVCCVAARGGYATRYGYVRGGHWRGPGVPYLLR